MSRYFKKITLDIFQKHTHWLYTREELPKSVTDDLGKVKFDFENLKFDTSSGISPLKYPLGYREFDNGLVALLASAGGDWQLPVCFVIYYDGKKLRGYVPSKGNIWNHEKKRAYNNDEISHDVLKMSDETLLIEDVLNRLQSIPETNSRMEFNEEQLEWIEDCKTYHVDLSKGFYWQIAEELEFEEPGSILINPKDHWDREHNLFDQHSSAEMFLTNPEDRDKLGEVSESQFEFYDTREEFERIMRENAPFFEYKKMFEG